jgi:hypothetical protein
MTTFEELMKMWNENQAAPSPYDQRSIEKIVRSRTKKHINKAMQYFWAAFTLQILVYGLLSHMMIKYGSDTETLLLSIAGVILFLTFTIMLLKKFKRLAVAKPKLSEPSLYHYVFHQHSSLESFYSFKKRYELILIPLSSAIGVFLTFKLFVPGGVQENPTGAIITFAATLISCVLAIRSENKRNFAQPLHQLEKVMEEFKHDE